MSTDEVVLDLCRSVLLPSLERRLDTLIHEVGNVKKGVVNKFKSFWRKPREGLDPGDGTNSLPFYKHDRIESKVLLLADTAFSIQVSTSQIYLFYLFFWFFLAIWRSSPLL